MIKTNNYKKEKDEINNSGDILIEGVKKPWNEGTIHILWPSVSASKDDESFVAWCRESAKGSLKKPNEIFPVEDSDRICNTCIEKAKNSDSIETPDFVKNMEVNTQ